MHPSEKQNEQEKNKEFRLNSQAFLLTWPQTDTTKEDALNSLTSKDWPIPLKWSIVCQESHADGHKHLHAVVCFEEKLRTRCSTFFDFVCNKHPNISGCRSLKRSVQYVAKHGDYITTSDFPKELLSKNSSKAAAVAGLIIGGSSLREVHDSDPGYFLQNKRKIEEYQAFVEKKMRLRKMQWQLFPLEECGEDPTGLVKQWLNQNLFQNRAYGSQDLFIHGTTGLGKTSLINWLEQYCRIYVIPNEDFFDLYDDDDYDLAVYDEFKASKTVQWMNMWCQSSQMFLKKKGTTGIVKKKHLPTIILSNYSLRDNYHVMSEKNDVALCALERRLLTVHLTSFLNIK